MSSDDVIHIHDVTRNGRVIVCLLCYHEISNYSKSQFCRRTTFWLVIFILTSRKYILSSGKHYQSVTARRANDVAFWTTARFDLLRFLQKMSEKYSHKKSNSRSRFVSNNNLPKAAPLNWPKCVICVP